MSTASVAPTGLIILIGALIGLGIYFAPSALAILKGNVFKGQVIKYQFIILAITIVVAVVVCIFVVFLPSSFGQKEMASATNTEVAFGRGEMIEEIPQTPEVEVSAQSSASGARILLVICSIGGGIWSLISIVLWFYILIHALRDQQMTLLSRFGINI